MKQQNHRTTRRFFVGALFSLLACAASPLFATSYYVDNVSGSDANAGTSTTTAWKHSPGDPAATGVVQNVSLVPGDTVYFKGGTLYSFTGTTGIQLKWSGSATAPITYDGNSDGTWGTGHAKFTDHYGSNGITGFSTSSDLSYVNFRAVDFGAIGGSSTFPTDTGSPAPARFGGGIAIGGVASHITIDNCGFRNLGYSYTQKPMSAASINGVGISLNDVDNVVISNGDFTSIGTGIDLSGAKSLKDLTISGSTFKTGVCWTINMPVAPTTSSNVVITGCTDTNNNQYATAMWTGYGNSPRADAQTAVVGAPVTFVATAAATPDATFQWRRNGSAITGATGPTYTIASAQSTDAGTYTVVATNTAGSTTSNDAFLTVTTVSPSLAMAPAVFDATDASAVAGSGTGSSGSTGSSSGDTAGSSSDLSQSNDSASAIADASLTDVSVRAHVADGSKALVVGFALDGTDSTHVLVRGVGPSLAKFGVTNPLMDPKLDLAAGNKIIADNTSWTNASNAADIFATSATVGAFDLDATLPDSAVLSTLTPGAYVATLTSQTGADGDALVQIYDAASDKGAHLANVSARAYVSQGSSPVVGFTVSGSKSKKVLIRAVGPSLAGLGVDDAISDPTIHVYSGTTLVAQNDNWAGDTTLSQAFTATGAFPLSGNDSKDAAVIVDAAPGTYSVVVSGVSNASGAVIIDIYQLP